MSDDWEGPRDFDITVSGLFLNSRFGPHISTEALWEVARRVDIRKPIERN